MASKLEEITMHVIAVDDEELNLILWALESVDDPYRDDADRLIEELSGEDAQECYCDDCVSCGDQDLAESIMNQIYGETKNGGKVSVVRK